MSGIRLITEIAANTGLPEATMTKELGRLIEDAGLDSKIVSLDELRRVLADYVQDILLSAKTSVEQEMLQTASGE
jgi:hypothetical protein